LLLLLCPFDESAEEGAGPVEPRSDRSDRAPGDFRDFLVAVFFDIGQDHDLTLFGGKGRERSGERLPELSIDVIVDRCDRQGALAPELLRSVVFRYLFLETSFSSS
jgi:hypothetical protein